MQPSFFMVGIAGSGKEASESMENGDEVSFTDKDACATKLLATDTRSGT